MAELQQDFVMRYLEPEPHMALAKYYFDQGNRIEAFYISEAARRTRFEEKIFDPAFHRVFTGFDNRKAAESRLLAEYARDPDSIDTIDRLADIYISRSDLVNARRYLLIAIQKKPDNYRFTGGLARVLAAEGKRDQADALTQDYLRKFPNTADGFDLRAYALIEKDPLEARRISEEGLKLFPTDGSLFFDLGMVYQGKDNQKAEEALVKAAKLSPEADVIQTWVGRFFFRIKQDNRRALEYYLNAYFLNPHAYETEFVESRIRKISFQLASERLEEQTRAGQPLASMLADPDFRVISLALSQMTEQWQPAYIDPIVKLMGHEDQGIRAQAMEALKAKVDSSFDKQLRALLKDDDLRKRGLAAYIAVYRWKGASFAAMKSLLAEESQLLRFDAISALMIDGGTAGRRLALAHARHEPNATLKQLITTSERTTDRINKKRRD